MPCCAGAGPGPPWEGGLPPSGRPPGWGEACCRGKDATGISCHWSVARVRVVTANPQLLSRVLENVILTGSAPFFNVSVKCPRLRFNQGPSPSSPSVAVCLEPRPPRPAPWDPAHSPLTGGLPATAVLLSPVTVTSVLGFVLGEGSGETWTRRGRGAACPALSPGWKSFKTTPFLRASGQSISWPCQPPGCRSGHFPGQSHCHSSAWVAVPPPPRHPHLLSRLPSPPLPRRPALPCRGGPLRAPLTVPGPPVTLPWALFSGAETRTDPPGREEPGRQLGRLTGTPAVAPGGVSPAAPAPVCGRAGPGRAQGSPGQVRAEEPLARMEWSVSAAGA